MASFTHKSSVTVTELRDYITRRKNEIISIVKMLVLILGYALFFTPLCFKADR